MINILLAAGLSMLISLIGTPYLIRLLRAKQYGQFIREDGPQSHQTKRGTPTMGGLVIVAAVTLAYFGSHLLLWNPVTLSSVLLIGLTLALALLGFLDDWSKISKERSLGLTARGKLLGQFIIGVAFGALALNFPDENGLRPASQFVSLLRDINWLHLPLAAAIIWITFLIMAWSNAVNLTDGLDGLAAGSSTLVFSAYALVNIWHFNQRCAQVMMATSHCYEARDPYDLAVVAAAFAGATFGFLWWNAKPAQIFMGDTGSMAIGGALAGLAVMTRTELLLVILGFLFVMEAGSVALQVAFFKATKGRRIFKMSPIHHHFELSGWQEITVVIRFWIIAGVCVAIGLGLFYAEWIIGQ
ncbi:MAG: phospho-N-acetylmuramoyl-pentapeptide-transferase [Arachnia propionica]|nr:MAG: phospho-N-acetylmuramoyl-pentapeptide-transferase [Arachnia propionica]